MKYIKKGISILLCVLFAFSFGVLAFAEDHVHSYKPTHVYATCTEWGYTVYVCECGDSYKDAYVAPTGHHYGGWDAVQKATCVSEGILERTCTQCGAVQTKTIPVLDHYDGNKDGKCDTCGTDVEIVDIYSPFDWFMDLFKTLFEKIKALFSVFAN